jgi:hypothetical protein
MTDPEIIQVGELDWNDANSSNIPVSISLDKDKDVFRLMAANFMPRRDLVRPGVWEFECSSKEALLAKVKEHWQPLYVQALNKMQQLLDGKQDNVYYWSKD